MPVDTLSKKRMQEQRIVGEMIALYCRKNHHGKRGQLCPDCRQLMDYAEQRIRHCPLMEQKTFCSACKVHCYSPRMREQIRTVMRFSGPLMLLYHPVLALRHVGVTIQQKWSQKQ